MKFKPDGFYRHKNSLDMDIRVIKAYDNPDTSVVTLVVQYYNRIHDSLYWQDVEVIDVKRQDLANWKEIKD